MIVQRLPYVPGFGGHRHRSECKCTEADELICGRPHPDKHESKSTIDRRQRGAVAVSRREAQISSWLAGLFGTGAEGGKEVRASRGSFDKYQANERRRREPLSVSEEKAALEWMCTQPIRRGLPRPEVVSQAWIELLSPPKKAKTTASFDQELQRAWWRAHDVLTKQTMPATATSRPTDYDVSGRKRTATDLNKALEESWAKRSTAPKIGGRQ